MPNIVITGTLTEILAKLRRIKAVAEKLNAEGWSILRHDESWLYETVNDGGVCPTCTPFNGNNYRGDYMTYEFPYLEATAPTKLQVHNETNYHTAQRCRCTAQWVNVHEVLVQRVTEEMENA